MAPSRSRRFKKRCASRATQMTAVAVASSGTVGASSSTSSPLTFITFTEADFKRPVTKEEINDAENLCIGVGVIQNWLLA